MARIIWHEGRPPEEHRDRRLLLIANHLGGAFDVAEDNRPDLYVGHFLESGNVVPTRIRGMSASDAPELKVLYWAEIDLPPGIELRDLTIEDFKG
jgi:hypothetical protein